MITSSDFTTPAYNLARKVGVDLWNRKTLVEQIMETRGEGWNDFLSKYYEKASRNRESAV